jgi:hypothetical protein
MSDDVGASERTPNSNDPVLELPPTIGTEAECDAAFRWASDAPVDDGLPPAWWALGTDYVAALGPVHVVPVQGSDVVMHTIDENCVCGPTVERVETGHGDEWLCVHHSLDGRETREEPTP